MNQSRFSSAIPCQIKFSFDSTFLFGYTVISDQVPDTYEDWNRGRTCGPSFNYILEISMIKPYLNYSDQINLLSQSKELLISDTYYAMQMLTDIGYFSLIGGYKTPFINPMTRKYEVSTTFEDIVALYQFDQSLRSITFNYLNIVEQKIGQLIADAFCSHFGEQQSAYLDPNNYSSRASNFKIISGLINILNRVANQSTDHKYIVHQRNVHQNVPLWVLRKALTFGQLSKMYSVLQIQQQRAIAEVYGHFTEKQLAGALSCLTYFRNVCAHNERLYCFRILQHDFPDTKLHDKLNVPKKGHHYTLGKNDYFGVVIMLRYLLRGDDFRTYKRKLKSIITKYLNSSTRLSESELLGYMGFPSNWEEISKFRL